MGLILPGEAAAIADRVRQGDPTVGWRGDPGMDTYVSDRHGVAQVWSFDARGTRYCAAQVPLSEPGWQHTLLKKLRDGDWQNPDTIRDIFAANDANTRRQAAERAERCGAAADHVIYEFRRAVGQHYGGLRRRFYPVS